MPPWDETGLMTGVIASTGANTGSPEKVRGFVHVRGVGGLVAGAIIHCSCRRRFRAK